MTKLIIVIVFQTPFSLNKANINEDIKPFIKIILPISPLTLPTAMNIIRKVKISKAKETFPKSYPNTSHVPPLPCYYLILSNDYYFTTFTAIKKRR